MHIETRRRIASLTSSILNPFLVSIVTILLLSFASTSSILDALKWALILIVLSILPVFLVTIYLVRNGLLDSVFTSVRGQRTKIYLVAGVCIVIGWVALFYFEAPLALVAAFTVGFSAVVIFMCINLLWKISLHSAFLAASVTISIILYGWIAAVTIVLVPLMSWARVELRQHSLAQVGTGASLAALIVVAVFYRFGLV